MNGNPDSNHNVAQPLTDQIGIKANKDQTSPQSNEDITVRTGQGFDVYQSRRFPAFKVDPGNVESSTTRTVVLPQPNLPDRRTSPRKYFVFILLSCLFTFIGYEIYSYCKYSAYGTVVTRDIGIYTPIEGVMTKVLVSEGDHVTQGQELAVIENPELTTQIDRLSDDLKLAQSQLEAKHSEVTWTSGDNRQIFSRVTSDYNRLISDISVAEAALVSSKANFKRLEQLTAQHAVSEADYDKVKYEIQGLEGKIKFQKVALSELERATKESSGLRSDGILQLKPFIDKLANTQAELGRLREKIESGKIKSTTNGYVIKRNKYAGEYVSKVDPVFLVSEENSEEIELYVKQAGIDYYTLGRVINIEIGSGNVEVPCTIMSVSRNLTPAASTLSKYYLFDEKLFTVHLKPANPKIKLTSGSDAFVLRTFLWDN